MNTDRIEKKILLHAPHATVWRAISDPSQFGSWFGVEFDGPFAEGSRLSGRIAPTKVDPEVARLQAPHAGKAFEFFVERIEPMRRISFRWHPFAVQPAVDYSKEPMTLIVFELQTFGAAVQLTITESGFDRIPIERRAEAFKANDGGWAMQTQLVQKFLERRAGHESVHQARSIQSPNSLVPNRVRNPSGTPS